MDLVRGLFFAKGEQYVTGLPRSGEPVLAAERENPERGLPMQEVEKYYDEHAQAEWERLERHPMEFALTMRALQEYLVPESRILDVGGGPGRYAIALAQLGHRVTLVDLSLANVELGREKAREAGVVLEGFVHGNALDLSAFADAGYDAVLLFGPLYHLIEEKNRDRAISEALAKLKPGGLLFAAFINRYAFIVDMMKHDPESLLTNVNVQALIQSGINRGATGFTEAWFAHPGEIKPLMEGHGLTTLKFMSKEGMVAPVEQSINELPPEHFKAWKDLSWQLAEEECLLGIAEHLLYIGKK
ncbi:MAG: class I SAM-dependent methyltransferase [Bacillota bacterium]